MVERPVLSRPGGVEGAAGVLDLAMC
jgi:hypothetical protein